MVYNRESVKTVVPYEDISLVVYRQEESSVLRICLQWFKAANILK